MSKDDATWLNVCHILFGLVAAFVGYKFMSTLGVQFNWLERYDTWYPTLSNVVAISLGAGSAFYIRSRSDLREYHLLSIAELRKVTWPSPQDTKQMTLVVVIVVAIFSVILSAFDLAWSWVLKLLLS